MAFHFHGSSSLVTFLVAISSEKYLVHGDIPVHCTQPDVVGLWRFHVGTFEGPNGPDSQCGFTAPDGPDGHHELTPPNAPPSEPSKGAYFLTDKFKKAYSMEVLLRDWTSRVVSVDPAGKEHFPIDVEKMTGGEWTMVYDEGFHVNVGGGQEGQHSFLAFSKYMLGGEASAGSMDNSGNKQHSFCSNTLLGWYRQIDPSTGTIKRQQCWWGERIKTLHEALASLPASLAGPPVGLPPVLPLPLMDPFAAGKDAKNKAPPSSGSAQPPAAPAGLRGAVDSAEDGLSSSLQGGSNLGAVKFKDLFRRALQGLMALLLTLTVFASYRSTLAVADKEKGRFNMWHVVALISGVLAVGMAGALFFGSSHAVDRQTVYEDVAAKSPIAAAAMDAPTRRTLGEDADKLHAGLQEARNNGTAVHWQSSPEKFKKWLRERHEKHGMNVHESSSIEELLDAISPPRLVGGVGFETEQVIGPVRAVAIKEQLEIAHSMGKSASELTTEDVKDTWTGNSDTNHHNDKTFTMDGKALAPEGWRTLPDFDWRNVSLAMPGGQSITNFVNSVPDQGGCGSCYAVAATSMITSRLMLKYPELHTKFAEHEGGDRISVDQQLNCNQFNQGCSGGYPYLISAWSFANDVVSDKCIQQSAKGSTNSTKSNTCQREFKGESCGERFRVKNWRYLGGSLGRCGLHHLCEDAMREELYKGGPLAVSIEPGAGFGYADGVYHGVAGLDDKHMAFEVPKKDNKSCKDLNGECYIWRKVDHSVLLVGWGEDLTQGRTCQPRVHRTAETEAALPDAGCEAIKSEQDCAKKSECIFRGFPYWIIQNSYGPGFGKEGYLSFGPRGQDPMRVESMTLAADVTWVNRPGREDIGSSKALPGEVSLATAVKHRNFGA